MSSNIKSIQMLLIGLAAAFAFHTSSAATQMRILEDARETNTSEVMISGSDTGTLYFKNCIPCNENPLHLSKTSKFLIGKLEVDFAEFKKTAESRDVFMMVFYEPKTHVITRMKL